MDASRAKHIGIEIDGGLLPSHETHATA
jgi:hypothetical protein